ncbi:MAG TPA: diadenylate cyclase CdaA [Chloroflexota bacterium]|nr:diadenylate cyclase CdaA [Chloroflexota bacterium]
MQEALWLLSKLNLLAVLDILLVALIFYGLLVLIRGTQADQVVRGGLILLLASALVGSFFKLTIFNWLLQSTIPALLIAIPVIFQPELRRALEQLGRTGNIINYPLHLHITTNVEKLAEELARACTLLTDKGYGGLIVIERTTGLEDIIQTGTRIDGTVTAELIQQIFYRGSPLHDGAVVIRDDRIVAARCLLPLTDDSELDPELGTRHRAALGVTENTDAVCIVISEETGAISLANHGHLVRQLNDQKLRLLLTALLQTPSGIPGLGNNNPPDEGPEGARLPASDGTGPVGGAVRPPNGRPVSNGLGALGSLLGRRLGWRAGR